MDRLKLEVKRASGPFLLLVLLIVAGILTGADIVRNLAGDKPWVKYSEYKAQFADTKGVVPSRVELRLAGVKAGSIKKSEIKNGQAVLTMNLEKKYAPLYKDAKIRIRPVTPLEDMYVDITSRGTPAAGKLGKSDILGGQNTISPVEIGTVLDVLDKGTRANVANLLDELGKGLDDHGQKLRETFVALAPFLVAAHKMSVAVDSRRQNLKRLIHQFGGITSELAQHDTQLAQFVTNADQTLAQLASDDRPFNDTLAELPPTLDALQSSFANLRQTEDVLDPTLKSLDPVANKLPKGLDSLSDFAVAATPALNALRPAARALRPLATTLKPTSSDLSGAFAALKKDAPQIDEFTRKTVPCLPETSTLLQRAMSFTKFGDVNQQGGNVGDARADVRADFTTFGEFGKDPGWTLYTPCNMKGGSK